MTRGTARTTSSTGTENFTTPKTDIRTYCKSEVKRWGFPFRIIDNDTREVIEEFHKETGDERG